MNHIAFGLALVLLAPLNLFGSSEQEPLCTLEIAYEKSDRSQKPAAAKAFAEGLTTCLRNNQYPSEPCSWSEKNWHFTSYRMDKYSCAKRIKLLLKKHSVLAELPTVAHGEELKQAIHDGTIDFMTAIASGDARLFYLEWNTVEHMKWGFVFEDKIPPSVLGLSDKDVDELSRMANEYGWKVRKEEEVR